MRVWVWRHKDADIDHDRNLMQLLNNFAEHYPRLSEKKKFSLNPHLPLSWGTSLPIEGWSPILSKWLLSEKCHFQQTKLQCNASLECANTCPNSITTCPKQSCHWGALPKMTPYFFGLKVTKQSLTQLNVSSLQQPRCAIRPTPPSDTSSRRIWLCHRWGFKKGTLSVSLPAPSALQKETMIKSRKSVLGSYPRWIKGITTCTANMTSQSTQTTNRWRQSLRNPWAEPPVDCKEWCWRFLWQTHCLAHPLVFMMS